MFRPSSYSHQPHKVSRITLSRSENMTKPSRKSNSFRFGFAFRLAKCRLEQPFARGQQAFPGVYLRKGTRSKCSQRTSSSLCPTEISGRAPKLRMGCLFENQSPPPPKKKKKKEKKEAQVISPTACGALFSARTTPQPSQPCAVGRRQFV